MVNVATDDATDVEKGIAANNDRPVSGHLWDGHYVLRNNKTKILNKLHADGNQPKMLPPDEMWKDKLDTETQSYNRMYYLQSGLSSSTITAAKAQYTTDYNTWYNSFFDFAFVGGIEGWLPEPLRFLQTEPHFRPGIDGYPPTYRWWFGCAPVDEYAEHHFLYVASYYLIGFQSHDTDSDGNPVDLFLPIPAVESD